LFDCDRDSHVIDVVDISSWVEDHVGLHVALVHQVVLHGCVNVVVGLHKLPANVESGSGVNTDVGISIVVGTVGTRVGFHIRKMIVQVFEHSKFLFILETVRH
jgi:hypothetical protein